MPYDMDLSFLRSATRAQDKRHARTEGRVTGLEERVDGHDMDLSFLRSATRAQDRRHTATEGRVTAAEGRLDDLDSRVNRHRDKVHQGFLDVHQRLGRLEGNGINPLGLFAGVFVLVALLGVLFNWWHDVALYTMKIEGHDGASQVVIDHVDSLRVWAFGILISLLVALLVVWVASLVRPRQHEEDEVVEERRTVQQADAPTQPLPAQPAPQRVGARNNA